MNTSLLFSTLKLSQIQIDSVNAILESCEKHGVTDLHQISYILATAKHESNFKPIEEIGKGAGLPYGKKFDIGQGPGKRIAYTIPDKLYYGRGFVQLTWKANYAAFGHLLNIDLVNTPELALQTDYAAEILVVGMQKGMFTGMSLNHFFNPNLVDAIDARTIINGHDKAILIESYFTEIYKSLTT